MVADVDVNVDVGVLTIVWVVWLKDVVEHGANNVFVATLKIVKEFIRSHSRPTRSQTTHDDVKKFVISTGTCAVLTDPESEAVSIVYERKAQK